VSIFQEVETLGDRVLLQHCAVYKFSLLTYFHVSEL